MEDEIRPFFVIEKDLKDAISRLPVWPTLDQIIEMIRGHRLYSKLENNQNDEKVMQLASFIIRKVEVDFYDHEHYHSTEKEILDSLRGKTDNFRIIEESRLSGMKPQYSDVQERIHEAFELRIQHFANSIYEQNRNCLSLEELERVVPHLPDSPHWIRQKVMLLYLERMRNLKPRGEEFDVTLAILKSEVDQLELELQARRNVQ